MGRNECGQLGTNDISHRYSPEKIKDNVIMANCGDDFSLLLTENKQVYSMGNNSDGQVQLGVFQG